MQMPSMFSRKMPRTGTACSEALFELTGDRSQDDEPAAPPSPDRPADVGGKDLLA
jgi:hypothetical protein